MQVCLPQPERRGAVRRLLLGWLKERALDTLAPRVASFIMDSWKPRAQRQTLAGFVAARQRGVFLIWITGHALALIDGKVIDSHGSKPRARLEAAWKFGD